MTHSIQMFVTKLSRRSPRATLLPGERGEAGVTTTTASPVAQISAIQGNKGLWDRVPEPEHPVLVANGAHDVLTPTSALSPGQ